ncbi:MAG: DUF4838 domain-containing protein [Kiritimatiellaeota bacterium]|nr:DUF4838 domain-containing protein [Kiritimatiellota bacterium]
MKHRTFFRTTNCLTCLFLTISIGWAAEKGKNIFPDPGFERTGVPGPAHTGQRSGHLQVGTKQHWLCIGGRLDVEPFATYHVTGFVKARVGAGALFALYVYAWNSFDWAFVRSVPLRTTQDWRRIDVTFSSPSDHVFFHPLAFIGARDSEAWIDDVTVRKVRDAEATVAPLLAKARHSDAERQYLARYYLDRGKPERAQALMNGASAYTRADIACLLAKHTRDPGRKRALIKIFLVNGGAGYSNGLTRLSELTAGLNPGEVRSLYREAVLDSGGQPAAAKALAVRIQDALGRTGGAVTVAREREQIQALKADLERVLEALPEDAPGRKFLTGAATQLEEAMTKNARRRADLGRCQVLIGGRLVAPDSHAIVIPDKPTPQEQHAASDLQKHLESIMGAAPPIVSDSRCGERIPLVVGRSALLKKLGVSVDWKALGQEGILIRTVGPALVLAGNKRGVLYACYTFLEDYLGCRWFTPDCTILPKRGTLAVPKVDRTYVPPLEYRATDYPNSRDADWAVRNKINGTQTRLDEERGGKITYRGFVHTFNSLLPPSEYFAEHPEYYSEIGGKRVGPQRTQLCMTNPDVVRFVTAAIRRRMRESPDATIFSVSQNDWGNYCQCPKCRALAEKEGSQAGVLIHFVNAIADAVRDEFPTKIVDTLAYQWSRKPPLHVRPRPNVAVRLCSIECCFAHPLATDPFNASFRRDIEGWNRICNRLHIWDYVINYAHCIMPFPNLYVLKPNIDFFVNHGVTGIYEEADYFTRGGEFAELRTWIMAKTLWDPSYDTDKAIDEFLAAYYGKAAAPMRQYIDLVHDQVRNNPDLHVRIYSPPSAGYLTPEVIRKSVQLFDRAEKRVEADPVRLQRTRVARLPLLYTRIALSRGGGYIEKGDQLVPAAAEADVRTLVERFAKIAKAAGVTHIREGRRGYLGPWLARQQERGKSLPIIRLRTPHLDAVVVPGRGGRIWRLRSLAGGVPVDIFKRFGDPDRGFEPAEGGYEEYSESGYRSPGWDESYRVTFQSDTAVTMAAELGNGFKVERTIELLPDRPEFQVHTTLTNVARGPQTACIRVHPAFAVGSTQDVVVWVKKADGRWGRFPLAVQNDPLKEREKWLRGDALPAGEWAWVDRGRDFGVLDRFEPGDVTTAYVNWNGGQQRVNLELWSRTVKLPVGETLTLTHVYRVLRSARRWEARDEK